MEQMNLGKTPLNSGDSFNLYVNPATASVRHGTEANPDERSEACTESTNNVEPKRSSSSERITSATKYE